MTANRGLGTSPLGVGPYGFGTPATTPTPGGGVQRDADGQTQGSLALSTSGQYVFDAFGRRMGAPDVRHMVTLAALTVKGSSVDPKLGQTFFESRVVSPTFTQDQRARVEACFKDLVDRGLVTIDKISVEPGNGMPSVTRVTLIDQTNKKPIDIII